jgi:Ca2+-binding RTX toxin-like protein
LLIANSPDFETQSSYNIRVQTQDVGGLTFEQELTVSVNDVNETPSANLPVFGTPGSDTLAVPEDLNGEQNIVFTGAENDEIDLTLSQIGGNRVFGGSGGDTIYVSQGDRVFGGSENDTFYAIDGQGGNRMSGGTGNDTFFLGDNDRALGGTGDDIFYIGEGGNNLIAGGAGVDQFWVVTAELPSSTNTILDLELGTDIIGIGGFTQTDLSFSSDADGNAILTVGGTNVATFQGITPTQLETANFTFT